MPKVEFLYFEDCPLYKQALGNLQAVLTEKHIETEIELINVDSPEKTERLGFYGSPSIRVDGIDLEGKNDGYVYACRMYEIDSQQVGVPTTEYIQKRLQILGIIDQD